MVHKKVILSLYMHACAGRRHLAGIFRYLAKGNSWDVQLNRNGELTSNMLENADGIISASHIGNEILRQIQARHIPLVVIDPPQTARSGSFGRIYSDDRSIGEAMARHILSYGNFRSYGFISDGWSRWSDERFKGFSEVLRAQNKPVELFCTPHKADAATRQQSLAKWMRDLPRPSVVMAAADAMAIEAIAAARTAKIRIPRDLAIVGTDDDELLCEYTKPRLTSIRPGHEGCGYAAAEELNRIFHGKAPRTRVIPFESITDRKSLVTCIPAVHLVEAAKDYIDKHACEGADVDAVARALGVSRRLLSLRYAECEKCSVHDALVSRRLAEVMKLLKKPDLSISEITGRCGFPNANYLKRLFKQRTGKTMREWRCRDSAGDGRNGRGTRRD